jgi:hypothetical protein
VVAFCDSNGNIASTLTEPYLRSENCMPRVDGESRPMANIEMGAVGLTAVVVGTLHHGE